MELRLPQESTASPPITSAFVGLETWSPNTLVLKETSEKREERRGGEQEGGRGSEMNTNVFAGVFTFYLTSDDKALLFINNILVVDSHTTPGYPLTGKYPFLLFSSFFVLILY